VWMIPEGSNIEEAKHSQLFGHTDTVTPGRSKDEQRSTGGFGISCIWDLGSKESWRGLTCHTSNLHLVDPLAGCSKFPLQRPLLLRWELRLLKAATLLALVRLVDWRPIRGTQPSRFQELEEPSLPSLSLLRAALLARLLVSLWRESWSVW